MIQACKQTKTRIEKEKDDEISCTFKLNFDGHRSKTRKK